MRIAFNDIKMKFKTPYTIQIVTVTSLSTTNSKIALEYNGTSVLCTSGSLSDFYSDSLKLALNRLIGYGPYTKQDQKKIKGIKNIILDINPNDSKAFEIVAP